MADDLKTRIAKALWEEEQVANKELLKRSDYASAEYANLNGRVLGLQRARDIVQGFKF